MILKEITIHTDGGSRGNPGPAAIGAVIDYPNPKTLEPQHKEYGEYIGQATNNEVEYQAVIFALKKAKALISAVRAKHTFVKVLLDSELLAKQLNGEYKIMTQNMIPLFVEVWNLKLDFQKVEFIHVPREKNQEADKLVNEALDDFTRKSKIKLFE